MSIKEINLCAFRNHDNLKLEFGAGVNVIWGPNGSGKTAVLESIYLLAYGRSFRTKKLLEALQIDRDSMNIAGLFEHNGVQQEIKLNQLSDNRRRFFLNGKKLNGTRDLIGLNPVIILSPEEQIITKGGPADRRAYFDRVFSVASREYVNVLADYTRILKQRNAALLLAARGTISEPSVTAWNGKLVQEGAKIWQLRSAMTAEFANDLKQAAVDFTVDDPQIGLLYSLADGTNEGKFEQLLRDSYSVDLQRGHTSIGPHRDLFDFSFCEQDLRKFGSQGEHKLTLVVIKMAEGLYIRRHTSRVPTILLDDLFAKLDFRRSDQVLRALGTDAQTIITATDLVDLERRGIALGGTDDHSFHLERD